MFTATWTHEHQTLEATHVAFKIPTWRIYTTVLCQYEETTDVTKPLVHYISWKPLNKRLRTVGLIPQGHSEISEGAHRQVNGYKGLVTAGLLL